MLATVIIGKSGVHVATWPIHSPQHHLLQLPPCLPQLLTPIALMPAFQPLLPAELPVQPAPVWAPGQGCTGQDRRAHMGAHCGSGGDPDPGGGGGPGRFRALRCQGREVRGEGSVTNRGEQLRH